MPHHLTPAELAEALGSDPRDVISRCLETGVPIYHGRIDRTLFEASVREQAAGAPTASRSGL